MRAATRYGDPGLREELAAKDVPGVEVTVVDFDLTRHEDYLLSRLEATDLLIDATQRLDPTRPVVPNPWIAALPEDAVILDLAVDPYDFRVDPPRTKGIEGTPRQPRPVRLPGRRPRVGRARPRHRHARAAARPVLLRMARHRPDRLHAGLRTADRARARRRLRRPVGRTSTRAAPISTSAVARAELRRWLD